MIKSVTRNREFTGPTPHNVAILARPPNKRPAEHLILERRRIEDLREQSIAETKYNKQCDLKSAWERSTNRRIQKNVIKRQMENIFQQDHCVLQERRQRLREMLMAEEEQYIREMEAKEETIEERQEKMKMRAKQLKDKRERERLDFVKDKLDQKFRGECEELRATLSKQVRDEIFEDRDTQLTMQADQKEKEAQHEAFYADLWKSDMMAKAAREEQETKESIERNQATLEVLNMQKAAIESQREEEKHMKELEAEWLKEEAALRDYEEEQMRLEKRQKQQAAKRSRDKSIKMKNKQLEKERQEQIALDMKILNKVLEETENEAIEDENRKKNARDEMQRFMHYVDKTRQEEQGREKQLEDFINDEVETQWKKKDAKKRKEKEVRQKHLNHVLKTREEQIRDREEANLNEKAAEMRERKMLHDQMEEHRRLETERINRVREQNRIYQRDLEEQINYQKLLKEREMEQARKELQALQDAEVEYQRKLRSALDSPDRRKMHPLRINGHSASGNRAKTC